MRTCWITGASMLLALALAADGETPLGAGFTYQGQVLQNGQPIDGTANLTFALYDASTGGNLLGSQAVSNTPVSNGLFSVLLNDSGQFGASAFNGSKRWLQVTVNGTLLATRQELTSAPYAHFAQAPWRSNGTNLSYTGGKVGIGTASPAQSLSVAGTVQSSSGGFMFPDGTVQTTAASGGAGFWSANGTNIYKNNTGSVGIGTNAPTTLLDVRGALTLDSGGSPGFFTGTGPSELNRYVTLLNSAQYPSASGLKAGGVLVSDDYFYANPGKNDMIIKGRVGIGTSTLSYPLTIRAGGFGWIQTDGTRELGSWISSNGGWLGTRSNHPLYFYTNNSLPLVTLDTAGDLGIGTTSPARHLHTKASDVFVARFEGDQPAASVVEFKSASSNSTWEYGVTGASSSFELPAGSAYFYRQGAGVPNISMTPDDATRIHGTLKCNVLEILGADVAERFPAGDAKPEPGTVMEIDTEHPGELRVCREAYCHRVAGVVSGAGDVPVGAVLGNLPTSKDGPAIALSGRVWVRCEAAQEPIVPGDLLTTSSRPGLAMKATRREQAFGAVLGKAMTELKNGQGLVLVLVNLQ